MLSSGRRRGAVEWRIYHGLKWCLRLTKVLIIQSEEELPGHYLPENNNVNTRLLGLSRCILSELVSCSTIHSISNRPACPRIHSPGRCRHRHRRRRPLPPTSTSPCLTSPCRAGCTPPTPPRICKPPSSPRSLPPVLARRLRGLLHPSTPTWS